MRPSLIGRSSFALVLAATAILGRGRAEARPGSRAAALLERLARRGASTRTLELAFTQRKRLALFATEVVTHGTCLYQRPGRIRWQTNAPDAGVVLVRPDRVELRAPGEKPRRLPLSSSPVLAGAVGDLFFWLGVRGFEALEGRYRVEAGRSSAGRDSLLLRPRGGALKKRLERIQLRITSVGDVERIMLRERNGDRTIISLQPVARNRPLPSRAFR